MGTPLRHAAIGAAIALAALLTPVRAQTPTPNAPPAAPATAPQAQPSVDVPPSLAKLDPLKKQLDEVQDTLRQENLSADVLTKLRQTTITVADTLNDRIGQMTPRVAEAQARLNQLGPAPAKDAPAEAPTVAAEREHLTRVFSNLDGALKQMKLLSVRADQLGERVTERRHTLYARQLFQRSPSMLDPFFWVDVGKAVPAEFSNVGSLLSSWLDEIGGAGGLVKLFAALILIGGVVALAVAITRRWLPRLDAGPRSDTRFARARTGLGVFVWLAVRAPLVVAASVLVLDGFGLLSYRMDEVAQGLLVATVAAAFGRGVARGLLAPDKPERRLIAIDDGTAGCINDHLVWTTRVLAVAIVLQVIHKVVFAPLVLTVATNIIFGLAIAALLVHFIFCLRRAEEATAADTVIRAPWIRPIAWIIIATIVASLIAGYAGFAGFVALRAVVAGAVVGALYLLLVITDAVFTEILRGDTRRGRTLAANLGVASRNLELVGTLISAGVRVLLVLFALLLIVGPWEASTAGLFESLQSLPLGFRVGEIYISFRSILASAAVLIVALILTRVVQRWLQNQFLPRTSIEPSLQLSIATIFGYIGVITAISLALGGLGIDLQKIAIVAGALSVGIGFGLQSIVSNFVSGLILLAERPIRVGDQVVVKGESGWVRRVRVRATEIETFDRATVIIPNSEFITGVVMNWTHANSMGRFIVKVGVGYDSDPAQVRDLLLAIAADHPKVLRTPGPWAQLANLGDSALEFEMGCVVADVGDRGAVKSDIHFEILKRFRENGIDIPYPQREVRIRSAEGSAASPGAGDGGGFAAARPQS
ncbi:MAG: DUF3772 domain-containing protein [Variibacter sp.]